MSTTPIAAPMEDLRTTLEPNYSKLSERMATYRNWAIFRLFLPEQMEVLCCRMEDVDLSRKKLHQYDTEHYGSLHRGETLSSRSNEGSSNSQEEEITERRKMVYDLGEKIRIYSKNTLLLIETT
jgi:hypothetical protein